MSTHLFRLAATLLTAFLFCAGAKAQDDGARAYLPAPEGLDVVLVLGMSIDGNRSGDPSTVFEGADLGLDSVAGMYSRTFTLGDKPAAAFFVLPYGRVSGRVRTTLGDVSASTSGFGDVAFGGYVTLLGAPPTTLQEYATFKPTSSLGLLVKVAAPTGSYDSDRPLNIGANRWMLQVGVPITFYVGDSLVDPKLLTFEVMPSAAVFTDNDDPFGASETSQDVIYRVEGHVTKSLSAKHFLSLDALYTTGGETSTDGVASGSSQRSLALGTTYSYTPDGKNVFRATYGKNVHRNDTGMEGDMIRVFWTRAF